MYYNQKAMKLDQFLEIARQECGLLAGQPVLVGVSGGPDSLCLLDCFAHSSYPVIVAHFDHGLRPESTQDAEFVRKIAQSYDAPFITIREDVGSFADRARLSIEEAARQMRYRFLFDQARALSAQAIAVGHTADDQVETLLMHLLRGSGLAGLRAMRYVSVLPTLDPSLPLVRPLLPFWRAETLAWCEEKGLAPIQDPSNQDPTFLRNRLRHELLPYLETYNPQVRKVLWRTASVLAGEEAVVQSAVRQAWEGCFDHQSGGSLALNHAAFTRLDPALQRAVLRRAIAQIAPALQDVDFTAVERALRWANAPGSGAVDLVHNLRLFVESGRLWVAAPGEQTDTGDWPQVGEAQIELLPSCEVALGAGWQLSAEWVDTKIVPAFQAGVANSWEAWLDRDALAGPLSLRRAQPGERFQPLGLEGRSVKLSDFWVNEKLPRQARAAFPLVVSGGAIVWLPGFRPAHPCRIRPETRQALHLQMRRPL